VEAMVGILQEQLKRNGFDDFTKIEHQCMHFDINRSPANNHLSLNSLVAVLLPFLMSLQEACEKEF